MADRYSNIFVTAPSPENLKAVHEFIFKGFEALHYQVCVCVCKFLLTLHQILHLQKKLQSELSCFDVLY